MAPEAPNPIATHWPSAYVKAYYEAKYGPCGCPECAAKPASTSAKPTLPAGAGEWLKPEPYPPTVVDAPPKAPCVCPQCDTHRAERAARDEAAEKTRLRAEYEAALRNRVTAIETVDKAADAVVAFDRAARVAAAVKVHRSATSTMTERLASTAGMTEAELAAVYAAAK